MFELKSKNGEPKEKIRPLLPTSNVSAGLGNSFTTLFPISFFFKADPTIGKLNLHQLETKPLFH